MMWSINPNTFRASWLCRAREAMCYLSCYTLPFPHDALFLLENCPGSAHEQIIPTPVI
ncbi:hypothetical protein CC79DRAFT_862182 [Sarocladium strictum]